MSYADLKVVIETYSGLERDALHVHAALLIYILAMVAFRQTRKSRIPWLIVLAVELANEALDLRHAAATGEAADWAEGAKDLWNTMLWPTVLLLIGRYTTLFTHRTRVAPAAAPGDE